MKLKWLVGLPVLALLFLAAVSVFKNPPHASPPDAPLAVVRPPASNPPPPIAISVKPVASDPNAATVVTPGQRRMAVEAETERLTTWAAQGDPESLSHVIADLASPEKEIRLAAIDAAKQSGNPGIVPALKAAAVNATDTEERGVLLETADFLSLPPVDLTTSGDSKSVQRIHTAPASQRLAETRQP